jgi:hypothetical protein
MTAFWPDPSDNFETIPGAFPPPRTLSPIHLDFHFQPEPSEYEPSYSQEWEQSELSSEGDFATLETRTCLICFADANLDEFPSSAPTDQCDHLAQVCSTCIRQYLDVQVSGGDINCITCPQAPCRNTLTPSDVQRYADPHVFRR